MKQFIQGGRCSLPAEPRCVFALVRSLSDLERASHELGAYLSILRRGNPGATPETLHGIWVDAQGVANISDILSFVESPGVQRSARILEATGMSGIWMLCWLEAPAPAISRIDLVTALIETSGHEPHGPSPAHFIPVFASDASPASVEAEMQILMAGYPGLLLAPLRQDAGSGRLDLHAGHLHAPGVAH